MCRGRARSVAWLLTALYLVSAVAVPAAAEEVYRAVDEEGVVSFSDFPVPGAERLEVETVPANEDSAAASQALIEQQLAVAKALEESRLARRRVETERLQALAAREPQTIYYPVERSTYWGGYWRRPGYGYRPRRPGYRPGHPGYRPGRPGVGPPAYRPGHPGYGVGHGRPGGGHGGRQPTISKPFITDG